MFKKVYRRYKIIDFYPSKFFSNDRTFYRDSRPSIIEFFDRKPSIFYIYGYTVLPQTES